MGLFGYNVKDYAKNTDSFKSKVMDLQLKCGNNMGMGKLLNTIIIMLDRVEFPAKKDGKKQKMVDDRINNLLDSMYRDLQQKKPARMSAHAEMLLSAITDCRAFGEEAFEPKEIEAQEIMASCKSEIYDALSQKKALGERKEELLSEGERTTAEADMMRLEVEFNECVLKEERLDEDIAAFTETYNANLEAVNARSRVKSGVQLQSMSVVKNLAEFNREVEKGVQLFTEAHERNTEISNAAKEAKASVKGMHATSGSSSGFSDMVGARKAANMRDQVANAEGVQAEKPVSAFRSQLNNRQGD